MLRILFSFSKLIRSSSLVSGVGIPLQISRKIHAAVNSVKFNLAWICILSRFCFRTVPKSKVQDRDSSQESCHPVFIAHPD